MDEETRITQLILRAILTGHHNVSSIRLKTRLSQHTLATYLKRLKKKKLIFYEETWKNGQSIPCSITEKGFDWIIKTPCRETLEILNEVTNKLRTTETVENLRTILTEKMRTPKIANDQDIFGAVLGAIDSVYEPFDDLLVEIVRLENYFNPAKLLRNDDAWEKMDPKSWYYVFKPGMKQCLCWVPGTWPELENMISPESARKHMRDNKEKLKPVH